MIDLPGLLRIGDPIALAFTIRRVNEGGRHEVLWVRDRFLVEQIGIDSSSRPHRQLLSVTSLGKPATWRSVRKSSSERRLGPAIHPRTPI